MRLGRQAASTRVKFAAVVADDGIVHEMAALREAVGPQAHLMVDLHWKHTAAEAIRLIRRLEPHNLYFAEAPCAPEDIEGQALVARGIGAPLALGEELRTVFEWRPRFERALHGHQPARDGPHRRHRIRPHRPLAQAFHVDGHPARLHRHRHLHGGQPAGRRARCSTLPYHEYQHSIFDKNLRYVTGDMGCADGFYTVPTGPGLGVEPAAAMFDRVVG